MSSLRDARDPRDGYTADEMNAMIRGETTPAELCGPGSLIAARPKGCTCGYPTFSGTSVRFHTYACQIRTGFNLGHALNALTREVEQARSKFADFNSPHEGYAVIREELDELWEHVKANTGRTIEAREEAIQTDEGQVLPG